MQRILTGLSALVVLAACGAAQTGEPPDAAATQAPPAVAATAFLTSNAAPPAGAADTEGDGVLRDPEGRPFEYALLGQKLPAFTAPMADGSTFDSASINRWTVIDVWGAWCGDCVADGPYVEALSRAIDADPDLDFVSIHVPASAARATPEEMFGKYGSLEAYFESAGYTLPTVLDMDASLRETLQIKWTPSYLLVSPDGIVRGFRTDLSVVEDQPVKSFIKDIARVRGEVRTSLAPVIGPAGVMGLSGTTPFTLTSVEAAFPGHTVVSVTEGTGKEAQPVFHVRAAGTETPRFVVEADWSRGFVGSVRTDDPAVEGPNGVRVGTTRYTDLRQDVLPDCKSLGAGEEFTITCKSGASAPYYELYFQMDPDGPPLLTQMSFHPPVPAP